MSSENDAGLSCCFCVKSSKFFWKDLDAKTATKLLQKLPEGTFLLRRSSQHPLYEYTLSQRCPQNHVAHIRIGRDKSGRYLMDIDTTGSNLQIIGFSCIINLVNCWSRVYRDMGKTSCQLVPLKCDAGTGNLSPGYVNEDNTNVCFHDDKEADDSFYNFFRNSFNQKATKL